MKEKHLTIVIMCVLALQLAQIAACAYLYTYRIQPVLASAEETLTVVRQNAAEIPGFIEEARRTMKTVEEATSQVQPMVKHAESTMKNVDAATKKVNELQVPTTQSVFQQIPIVNWFVQ
jgi:transcriptional regulator